MQKELTFIKENGKWYIYLPKWPGPKSALTMVGGAHDILEEFGLKIKSNILHMVVSTDKIISPFILDRESYTLFGGAFYKFGSKEVWLCPVTLAVFGKYPKCISFTLRG